MKQKRRNYALASGEYSGVAYLEALALPALLALPRLFTLAGPCVSLLCWLEGWGGARGPECSLGEEDAEMCGPGWEVGCAVSGECKLYS